MLGIYEKSQNIFVKFSLLSVALEVGSFGVSFTFDSESNQRAHFSSVLGHIYHFLKFLMFFWLLILIVSLVCYCSFGYYLYLEECYFLLQHLLACLECVFCFIYLGTYGNFK